MAARSYRQYCAFARALDVLGDRWTLLIVRNLLLGAQTWSELRAGLPGVAKNLLAQRLKQLVEDGIVEHVDGPYALTARGRELEPVLFGLATWGERHFMGPPHEEDAFRLRYLMTSVRRKLRPRGDVRTLQIFVNDDPFVVQLGPAATVEQGEREAQTTLRCSLPGIRALLFSQTTIEQLVDDRLLTIEGDTAVVDEFRNALRDSTH